VTGRREAPSRLGFGAASLGSRVGEREGLRALHEAYDAGVNWFDLAPSYGDGEAEVIFAKFLAGRRDQLYICTKAGRTAGRASGAARLLRPLARRLVTVAPALRIVAARGRPSAEFRALSGQSIQDSLDASLRRLGVEQIDVLALHDPPLEDVLRQDVWRALEDIRASGKARGIGFAGASATALECARLGLAFDVLQIPFDLAGGALAHLTSAVVGNARHRRAVSFALRAAMNSVTASASRRRDVAATLRRLGYAMPAVEALYAAVLDLALQGPSDVILASMLRPDHRRSNLDRFQRPPIAPAVAIRAALGLPPVADAAA
jgi:aryl-alcohol dehydrogenase-like predicted oxidoreductase